MAEHSSQPKPEHIACDGHTLLRLVQVGCDWLDQHHTIVNQLNVFPVPDGDTGTNMLMTMRNAAREAQQNASNHIGQIAAAVANGAMMGSRGNSGTILSQLWQGFAHALRDQSTLNAELLVKGLRQASDTAYRGVIKPVEGTILTVAREAAEEAELAFEDTQNMVLILERVVLRAKDALSRTPEMLPILQKAGVVDSGGSGLTYIFEGMLKYVRGEAVDVTSIEVGPVEDLAFVLEPEDELGYGYDVQFILKGESLNVDVVRSAIDAMGWSTVVVGNENVIKVHVHVHDPGIPLSYGISLGAIADIVVENMQEQYHDYVRERTEQPAAFDEPETQFATAFGMELQENDVGVVAVAAGEGLARVFQQLGAAQLVMGGQTNNPSTQELLEAIQRVPTRNVILLPNNKNIFLAAEQAARLAKKQDVVVIPTRTMPQGISALLPYDPQGELQQVAAAMTEAKDHVITGEITTATRSVELDGVDVSQGQIIGLIDGKLAISGDSLEHVMRDVLETIRITEHELITLYYGVEVNQADAEALAADLREEYPEQEFELVFGGQAHYDYILSSE
ncbi:MAG: DAK2 domain-containing protein [Anaerolineae bacterium]|nr:DAK2 domain-containing protein [Anaerolineae bacterium]